MQLTNCVNCGAPLFSNDCTCSYCGTTYKNSKVYIQFDQENSFGSLSIGANSYDVYIAEVEFNRLVNCHRDFSGRLITSDPVIKRKFTLIEV